MKGIKKITLVLENCDSIDFDENEIYTIDIDNIKTHIKRLAVNNISKFNECTNVNIILKSFANKSYKMLDTDEELKFNRIISQNDITQIVVLFNDNTIETIYVPWCSTDEFDCINIYQKTLIKDGNLHISINKDNHSS